tara:strand:- start:25308 stop:25922 length:615 start_codon:yes stop_codon:yes gene_type:complete
MNNLLFYAKDTATLIGDESNQFSHGFKLTLDESKCENNTHEYLSNTWGVVESKEHAEFIIELAELHGFKIIERGEVFTPYFRIAGGVMCLNLPSSVFSKCELKQITIPLPPKSEEWPQVGDEVAWGGRELIGVVKAINNDQCWVLRPDNDCMTIRVKHLSKPKSKQDLLIEELQTKLCNNNAVDNYILACDIINGEIEGLSYES